LGAFAYFPIQSRQQPEITMQESPVDFEIIIIGAGLAGIGMAHQLQKAGRYDFVILERADKPGGTWRDNVYPGCACDIPSLLYSFSFAPNPHWSHRYATQPEILQYIEDCVVKFGLEPHIRYQAAVTGAAFEEIPGTWQLRLDDGQVLRARKVIAGLGPLNTVYIPPLAGLERFRGPYFHSAHWPVGLSLRGKRVAVIGTGASAIQIVPNIVDEVAKLYLFQRTAPWVVPRRDRAYLPFEHWLFRNLPFVQRFYRFVLYRYLELLGKGFMGNRFFAKLMRLQGTQHLEKQVADPELKEKVRPRFQPGCKRVLVSDDYYPALERPEVEVITGGATAIKPQGVVDEDGKTHEVEVIIFATGFHVAEHNVEIPLQGKAGRKLLEEWDREGMSGYYGVAASGYPNFFFLLGPNSGLGHNSMIHIMESQYQFILDYLDQLDRSGQAYWDIRPEAQATYNQELQQRFPQTVWAQGQCNSWYTDSQGRNTTLWVGLNDEYRRRTRRIRRQDFT
jgi:cation diffusion facilitator CzcD-associated flavoprotein CzcO